MRQLIQQFLILRRTRPQGKRRRGADESRIERQKSKAPRRMNGRLRASNVCLDLEQNFSRFVYTAIDDFCLMPVIRPTAAKPMPRSSALDGSGT